jgi:hypothetical protein
MGSFYVLANPDKQKECNASLIHCSSVISIAESSLTEKFRS